MGQIHQLQARIDPRRDPLHLSDIGVLQTKVGEKRQAIRCGKCGCCHVRLGGLDFEAIELSRITAD